LGACVRNYASIESKRNELILEDEGLSQDALGAQKRLHSLRNAKDLATDNCLNILEDVTNLFIVNSALTLASAISSASAPDLSTGLAATPNAPPLLGVATNNVMGIIEQLNADPTSMSPEEYIAQNCILVSPPYPLQNDINNVERYFDNTMEKRQTIKKQIESLNTALQ